MLIVQPIPLIYYIEDYMFIAIIRVSPWYFSAMYQKSQKHFSFRLCAVLWLCDKPRSVSSIASALLRVMRKEGRDRRTLLSRSHWTGLWEGEAEQEWKAMSPDKEDTGGGRKHCILREGLKSPAVAQAPCAWQRLWNRWRKVGTA